VSDATTLQHGEEVLRRRPRLTWTDAAGTHEANVDDVALIGSAPQAALVVDDRTVTRVHAELTPREDGLWVRDLGSRNGTFINGVRVDKGRIPHQGTLRLGSTEITVAYEVEPGPRAPTETSFGPLVGHTPVMRLLFSRLAKIGPTDVSVLVQGETGTGKELVARALHAASARREQPLAVVDCAALPDNLVEAELFGHVKGAFTGASEARRGAIEAADGGTVFLDEIGELPLHVQPKLLRVLESRQLRRIGEPNHRSVDVRFVSATHRDLAAMVSSGAFREDLYFRIAVIQVTVPPLRERIDDLPLLLAHMAPDARVDETLLAELRARPWLGNVRELRNFIERAHALGAEEALSMGATATDAPGRAPSLDGPYKAVREKWIDQFEKQYFQALLERHARNVAAAAQAAGVDRTYVYRMIRRYGL
jgi:two-component system, NtrC family, response regulator GlrR